MKTFILIFLVTITMEALVEYIEDMIEAAETKEYKTLRIHIESLVLGLCLAFAFRTMLFNSGFAEVVEGISINPTIDIILTGVLFSRGSNFIHNFIKAVEGLKGGSVYIEEEDEDEDEDEDEEDWDEDQQMLTEEE